MPLGQYQVIPRADPGGRGTSRFRHRLIRFRHFIGTTRQIAAGTVIKPIGARAAVGKVVNDDRADWREAWALFPGSVAMFGTRGQRRSAGCTSARSDTAGTPAPAARIIHVNEYRIDHPV